MKACAILAIVVVMITRITVVMTATRSLERGLFAYPVSRISIQATRCSEHWFNKGGYHPRVSRALGPGLCRILDMDFGEFPFYELR